MLTHQKTKPFICIEEGCNKSYSDHRSLRRHYEMHHGLRLLKDEEACESTPPPHDPHPPVVPSGVRAAESLAESPAPNHSLLPNRDLLRCIVSSLVAPKLPPAPSSAVGKGENDSRGPLPPSSSVYSQIACSAAAVRETPGEKALKDVYPCQKTLPSSSMYTIINTGNLSILGPSESHTTFPDRPSPAERDFPLEAGALEYWSNSGMPRFPLFRGQKFPSPVQQPSGGLQWVRNAPPLGPKAKGHGLYFGQLSSAGHDASQGILGPSHAFDSVRPAFECPEVLPFPPASLKTHGEVSGEARLRCFEETFSPAARLPDGPKRSLLQKGEAAPLFRQLFVKSKEASLSQDQLQVQSHLFQRVTKSQHVVSHTKVLAPPKEAEQGAAKAGARGFPQQADVLRPGGQPMENDGPPGTPRQADFSPDLEKEGHPPPWPPFHASALPSAATTSSASHAKHARPSKRCLECKDYPSPSQSALYENTPGNHTYGKPRELENDSPLPRKKEKAKACAKDPGGKGHSRSGRPRRKEKPKFDLASMASPSQVAMASFSLPSTSFESVARAKPKLTIFNRIQACCS